MIGRRFCPQPGRAFTLVEVLVSMGVLSLMVFMLTRVVGMTGTAIRQHERTLDAASQIRLVFDRLGTDLAGRAQRPDLFLAFEKTTGNDSFHFYSQVAGYSGVRQVASVEYRIQQSTAGRLFQLERGATGTDWSTANGGNALIFQPPGSATAVPEPAAGDYEVLADGIFRFEFCYLLTSGAVSNTPQSDYSDVQAVIVALAGLDEQGHQLLSGDQLQQLASALPDNADGQTPLQTWNVAMAQSGFAAGLPGPAIQNLRFYQRVFCVR